MSPDAMPPRDDDFERGLLNARSDSQMLGAAVAGRNLSAIEAAKAKADRGEFLSPFEREQARQYDEAKANTQRQFGETVAGAIDYRKKADDLPISPEYKAFKDAAGKVVWERPSPESTADNRSFCCLRNAAGHTLISLTVGNHIIEVDAEGKIVWELRDGDLPGVPVNRTTALAWLPNGNIVFSNYAARAPQPKLVEINRRKQVVWSYTDATNQGVHEFQVLDEAGKPLPEVLR